MPYEMRIPGQPAATFDTEAEAMAAARERLTANPDEELEVIDLSTGKAAAPGATTESRDDLKKGVGF